MKFFTHIHDGGEDTWAQCRENVCQSRQGNRVVGNILILAPPLHVGEHPPLAGLPFFGDDEEGAIV